MRISFRALTCIVAASAVMIGVGGAPSFAQTTTEPNPAPPKAPPHHRHILHPGIGSASSRNVGPSSTAGGGKVSPIFGAGNPSVPGAPSATTTTGGGGK